MKKCSLVILAILLLSSCSSIYNSNGEQLYLRSGNGPKLVVPPPLTAANISHFYDLPLQEGSASASIAPPTT